MTRAHWHPQLISKDNIHSNMEEIIIKHERLVEDRLLSAEVSLLTKWRVFLNKTDCSDLFLNLKSNSYLLCVTSC